MTTENCYQCIHRRNVPGDAHSRCAHPSVDSGGGDMMSGIMAMVEAMVGNKKVANPLNVRAHEHGVRMGWFMYPFNFDPAWMISCDGLTKKKEEPNG
jgi:hypothetical protein